MNLFKVLKFDSYSDIHEGSNSLITWFQVKKTEITVPPSQSPSVVCLPNNLKTNFIKQNFAWWNIWISHFSLQNRELLKQWNSISYWNGEILFVLITLWTIVSWQNYYIKELFWMDLYAFHHKPYLNIQQLVCFICISIANLTRSWSMKG